MKSKIVLSSAVFVAFVVGIFTFNSQQKVYADDKKVLYYTCSMHPSVKSDKPGACPVCGMGLEPVYAPADATAPNMSGGSTNAPTPYPLSTCVVSGEKLGGDMGEPITFIYQTNCINQEIKFSCAMCKPKFLKNPDKYMKIINKAEADAKK